MKLMSFVFPYDLYLHVRRFRNLLYTMWISSFLGKLGDASIIHYPCYLQGGGSKCIFIGEETCIQCHGVLGCWVRHGDNEQYNPQIIIGRGCNLGEYCQITAINSIIIGDGLLTGRFVYIGDNAHGGLSQEEANIPPAQRVLKSKGGIVIGKNVWIGDKATILGGVTIGDNVIIGAGAVVTHNIPSSCIVVGTPARIVKSL